MNCRCFHTRFLFLLTMLVVASAGSCVWSQKFSVTSFRDLPNDVSAFINPVRDLNDEDCALLKILASPDFVFSTPLGIVKRVDNVGEIWLYLPRGSKKMTIKHAELGVLRDYEFPSRLESHKTYEISIREPERRAVPMAAERIVTIVRDTLVLTRVDTLMISTAKPTIPFEADLLASVGFGGKASWLTGGVMIIAMKRHGAFLHVMTDFGSTGPISGVCDRNGMIAGEERFYSGRTRRKAYMIGAGAIHRAGGRLAVFEGIGYSSYTLAWQLAASEGGGYVKNNFYSCRGITAELGVMARFGRVAVSASLITVKGTQWFGSMGAGIRFGKGLRKMQ